MAQEVPLTSPPKKRARLKGGVDDWCCLCKSKQREKVQSSEQGVIKLKTASTQLKDNLLLSLADYDIKYHRNCYSAYVLKAQWSELKAKRSDQTTQNSGVFAVGETPPHASRLRRATGRRRTSIKPLICVICNAAKCKKNTTLHHISERERAKKFLEATRFNQDSVFDRTSTLGSVESVFAADLLCHKNCINRYLKLYSYRKSAHASDDVSITSNEVSEAFEKLVATINLENNAYSVSRLRSRMNDEFLQGSGLQVSGNRQMKRMLIDKFGESICFTYPKNRALSQLVMSANRSASSIAEKLRRESNHIQKCAEQLRAECKKYDFDLEDKLCDARDIASSFQHLQSDLPKSWREFFKNLFPSYACSENIQRKCSAIFQIMYEIIHDGVKQSPLCIGLAQTVHEISRSKFLITLLNRLGLCRSYDGVERQDQSLLRRIMQRSVGQRVPIPTHVHCHSRIRGAMDNFDHEEQTPSGIGGSHDTVLVIFQNETDIEHHESTQITDESVRENDRTKRCLQHILPCQEILPFQKPSKRGNVPPDFTRNRSADNSETSEIQAAHDSDTVWFLSRFMHYNHLQQTGTSGEIQLPGWSAFNSLLSTDDSPKTSTAFTPIIPHPATQFDTIYTCMVNFQDILKSLGQQNGSLWCDEGVYHIAKELQLLMPEKFSNIFLGLGGFHMSKCIISCIGNFLEESGADSVLTETETFGPVVVNSILTGSHYSRAVRGLSMLAEAMERLLWLSFLSSNDSCITPELKDAVEDLQVSSRNKDPAEARKAFSKCKDFVEKIKPKFEAFVNIQAANHVSFRYWHLFLTQLFQVLRDMTRAHRERKWGLYLHAMGRAVVLFFAFGKTNYARWTALFYEDCRKLHDTFPDIYEDFMQGSFVTKNTTRRFSCVPMDQALEQNYNKPAKGHGGIIGMTRRKEAVATHNLIILIKHEKAQITQVCRQFCGLVDEDEYSLHHEFSDSITKRDDECITNILKYILERGNPFSYTCERADKLTNLVTGKVFSNSNNVLDCVAIGTEAYKTFVEERFDNKTKTLMDPISKTVAGKRKSKAKTVDVQKETNNALRLIDIARTRGYSIEELLAYELTSTSFFLTTEGDYLKKSVKSDLPHELEKKLQQPVAVTLHSVQTGTAVIVDFMSVARSVPTKTLNINTFGEFAEHLWKQCRGFYAGCLRLDVVFDNYEEDSIKNYERLRRANVEPIEVIILGPSSPLPVEMQQFWASSANKIRLQQFFIRWLRQHLQTNPVPYVVHVGGAHEDDRHVCVRLNSEPECTISEMRCAHEEADDRLMVHLDNCTLSNTVKRVLVVSKDADVFACLLYHYAETWNSRGLSELWILCGRGKTRRTVPLHTLLVETNHDLVRILPAVHALTGCDTTSKVSTKQAALRAAEKCGLNLLLDFGTEELTMSMIERAEKFLLRALGSTDSTFDELRLSQYHHKKDLRSHFEKIVPTSHAIHLHIRRAYYQCRIWLHALSSNSVPTLDPINYGFTLNSDILMPQITARAPVPPDFPNPCTCGKCARQSVCPCRVAGIPCCQFCKCEGRVMCKNPLRRIYE